MRARPPRRPLEELDEGLPARMRRVARVADLRRRWRLCSSFGALWFGCSDPAEATGDDGTTNGMVSMGVVAAAETWMLAPTSADPVPEHRGLESACDRGFALEDGIFEIDSGLCNYAVFEQPLAFELAVGQTIHPFVWYDDLYAPEAAIAHMAWSLAGKIVWDVEIPIPSEGGWLETDIPIQAPMPAGALLVLHLHNHGYNNYRILDVEVP